MEPFCTNGRNGGLGGLGEGIATSGSGLPAGKRRLELELESLVVPEVSAAEEAGRLLADLPALWRDANLEERRKLLLGMLDAVYVETRELKQVVAIQPKPAFAPVFQVATAREGSGVNLIKESPQTSFEPWETDLCSWWRRGRVELPVQKAP